MISGRKVLLIVGGGIAAYKSLELVRLLKKGGASVTPVLTRAGAEFVTPLSLAALCGERVFSDLFDLGDEAEMGHIELSRSADLVVVAPATADLVSKLAGGGANDLASTLLLATDKRVLLAPAMNVRMWEHPATKRNFEIVAGDGALIVGPDEGEMACGEFGPGRMAEPPAILAAIDAALSGGGALEGRHVIVTSGPTREPIDPVRYIANRSSGRQGSAIGEALASRGARVTFVTGPTEAAQPLGCEIVEVESAREMRDAVLAALPADAAVFAAAVADWRVETAAADKVKKDGTGAPPKLALVENPDILREVSQMTSGRPGLVVGFAAETNDVVENARAKRLRKGCDWLLANDVSPSSGVMGGDHNAVTMISDQGEEAWPRLSKTETARRLVDRISTALA